MIGRFARHATLANLLMLIFLVLGVIALPNLQRATFPDFTRPEIQITVPYPGATAEEVEEAICQRVEDALDGIKFVEEVRSVAQEGVGVITVEMQEKAQDITIFQDDITTELDSINDFPEKAEEPVVRQLGTVDPVLTILVAGEMSPASLKDYCEGLRRRLQRLDEVSLIELEGFSDRQLRVELKGDALRQFGLTAADVASVISRQGVDMPAGTVETRDNNLLLRFVEQRSTPAELESLVVKGAQGGAEVRLGQIARIVDMFESDEVKSLLRNKRCGVLNVRKNKNQDVTTVADQVTDYIEGERLRQPNVDMRIINNDAPLVEDRISLVLTNAWQGLVLVFLSMWLFFNFRLSFWVVMSLPVSFLGAFFFMPYLGQNINMISLVAMLLATGLLMDDGIVIAENVARHISMGKDSMDAAGDGVSEVASGVFSSFLTTICVLGPLASLSGFIGAVMQVIPIVLILVMAISLVEAFLILPAHLGHSMHGHDPEKVSGFRRRFNLFFEWVTENVAGKMVDFAVNWRYLLLGSVLGLFFVSLGMLSSGTLAFEGFPSPEGDTIEARVLLPQGTPLSHTEKIVARITAGIEAVNEKYAPDQPDGQDLVNTYQVKFNENIDSFESGPHVATVTVDLLGSETRTVRIDELIAAWREASGQLPDVISASFGEPSFGPAGRPLEIRFQGDDLETLKEIASQARDWFASYDGTFNLSDDLRLGKQEYRIRVRDGAVGLGFDSSTLANQVSAAFQGATAKEIQVGPEQYEIVTRLAPGDRDSVADFKDFRVQLADGRQVPLSTVAKVEPARSWARIARVNGQRTVTLIGEVDLRVANTAQLVNLFQSEKLPELVAVHPNLAVTIEGETAESAKTSGSMIRGFLLGMIGVFVILSYQFESWTEPFIVMLAIPLALIGVIWGHLIMQVPFSIPSILGFVSLAGVVVNDSILLMLFLKNEAKEGLSPAQAAKMASRLRFRAIFLTSVTTISGLVPLMFESSSQAQTLVPLAVSICFGLLSSTGLILLVVPATYVIMCDLGIVTPAGATAH